MSGRLAGKVAVVTGSGNGIGQGCALMFAREGATVVGADLDVAGSEETVALAAAEGLIMDSVHPCDLTDPAQVEALMSRTVERHGGLHILLNAAAWIAFEFIEDMDYEAHWKRTIVGELERAVRALDLLDHGLRTALEGRRDSGAEAQVSLKRGTLNLRHARDAVARVAREIAILRPADVLAMPGGDRLGSVPVPSSSAFSDGPDDA